MILNISQSNLLIVLNYKRTFQVYLYFYNGKSSKKLGAIRKTVICKSLFINFIN